MKRKLLSLLLALGVVLSVSACTDSGSSASTAGAEAAASAVVTEAAAPETTAQEASISAAAEEASVPADSSLIEESEASAVEAAPVTEYPVTVTDQAGRDVTIEAQPTRLVSGYYISTSALIALGLQDSLVGIEAKAASRPIYQLSAPQLLELPSVGSAKEFDLEGCAALEPDLVILPMKLKDAAATLTDLGINVLLVNPEDQPLLNDMITLIGTATNTMDRAQALLGFTAKQESYLSETLSGAQTPSVYLAGNSSQLSTAGDAMYQSDMIRMAGGVNAAAEITDTYWADISYEQLLSWDPDYIILASDADYTVEDVLADANLADCKAVVNGNVYQIPGTTEAWDSPVPSGILGSLWLANVLHPDLVTVAECSSRIDDYYETFYGITVHEG